MPTLVQAIGFALAVGAIVLINGKKEQDGKFGLLLPVLLLVGGMADGMAKVYEELGNPAFSGLFLLTTFGVAFLLCLVLALRQQEKPGKWELLFGTLIGVPNYYCSHFLLWALRTVPGVIVYPVYCVGGILVVTVAAISVVSYYLSEPYSPSARWRRNWEG